MAKVAETSWWTDGSFEGRPVKQVLAVRDFGAVFRFGWRRPARWVVKEFLARLAEVLNERAWLDRWLTDGYESRSANRGQA